MSLLCLDWHLGVPDEHHMAWRWPRVNLPHLPSQSRVAKQMFVTVVLDVEDELPVKLKLAGCQWDAADVYTGDHKGEAALYVVYRRASAPRCFKGS